MKMKNNFTCCCPNSANNKGERWSINSSSSGNNKAKQNEDTDEDGVVAEDYAN